MWKTELKKRIGILTDSFNSDELAQRLWFLNATKVVFSHGRFYYWQNNQNAITKSFGLHQYSTLKTNLHLLNKMKEIKISRKIIDKYHRNYFSLFILPKDQVNSKQK